jgi:hypothetical protein
MFLSAPSPKEGPAKPLQPSPNFGEATPNFGETSLNFEEATPNFSETLQNFGETSGGAAAAAAAGVGVLRETATATIVGGVVRGVTVKGVASLVPAGVTPF